MKKTRLLAAVMMLLMIITMFSACGKDKAGNQSGSSDTVSTIENVDDVLSKDDIDLAAAGDDAWRIIRPENAEKYANDSAIKLFQQIKAVVGVSPKNVTDSDAETAHEILICDTNRAESATALAIMRKENVRGDGFVIASIGKKIVIFGMNEQALTAAVGYFCDNFVSKEPVKGGIYYVSKDDKTYANVTVGGTDLYGYTIVRPKNNVSYITLLEIENLRRDVAEKYGYTLGSKLDTECTASDREIIVGGAARDGVNAVSGADNIKITVSGTKIYLNGGSTTSVAGAVSALRQMLSGDVSLTDADSKETTYDAVSAGIDNTKDYKLTFKVDFESDTIDASKWNIIDEDTVITSVGQNGKRAYRFKRDLSNLRIADSKLIISATETNEAYYGGMLQSQNKMCFQYGYMEISCMMPYGDTFWTALWTRPAFATEYYWCEFDVYENFGRNNWTRGNIFPHLTQKGKDAGYQATGDGFEWTTKAQDSDSYWQELHTYGCEWTKDTVGFTIDGEFYVKKNVSELSTLIQNGLNQHAYLIISMSVGSDLLVTEQIKNVTAEQWANTSKYVVDEVKLYQLAGQDIRFNYTNSYGYTCNN